MAETGGGSSIEGNASAGADFVGRDQQQLAGNSVHVVMERFAEVSRAETDAIWKLVERIDQLGGRVDKFGDDVQELNRALIGDRFGTSGLVQQMQSIADASARRERRSTTTMYLALVLAVSQVGQWIFLYQIHELYWAVYTAVQAVK